MKELLHRGLLPAVLLLAGIGSLVWGSRCHIQPVQERQEIEETITLPNPMAPLMRPPGLGGGPGFGPPAPFMPPIKKTIRRPVTVTKREPEWVLVREITFGGLRRLESGELQRTYSGKAPSLCPT